MRNPSPSKQGWGKGRALDDAEQLEGSLGKDLFPNHGNHLFTQYYGMNSTFKRENKQRNKYDP